MPDQLTCLVVDPNGASRQFVHDTLSGAGYSCMEAATPFEAFAHLEMQAARTASPDSVQFAFVDVALTGLPADEFVRSLLSRWPNISIVVCTSADALPDAVRCLDAGALDYIVAPLSAGDLHARLGRIADKRRLLHENRAYRTELEERVAQQAHKYEELFLASLQSLADALEIKDAYTWGHSTRVARFGVAIAREMGIQGALLEQIELGGRLHDIGKIGVRESVLNKEGPLSADEYDHVMEHPVIGWRLLAPLLRDVPHALAIVRSHHERFDGAGSPDRLRGLEIPLGARIIAVADSFDAMTSGRVYRSVMATDAALAELRRCAGAQFDPAVVAAFERALVNGMLLERRRQERKRSFRVVA